MYEGVPMASKRLMLVFFMLALHLAAYAQWSNSSASNNPLSVRSSSEQYPFIIDDGTGGAFIAWRSNRSGNYDVYAQRLNGRGMKLWGNDGVIVCNATGDQGNGSGSNYQDPLLVLDGTGGVIIVWTDKRAGNNDIYVQRLNASGQPQWTTNGVVMCAAANGQDIPKIVSDGSGGAIISWSDRRDGGTIYPKIYAQRVNADGNVQWATNGILISTGSASSTHVNGDAVSDGAGGAIFTWHDDRNSSVSGFDIFAQRVNGNGQAQWTADGIAICAATSTQVYSNIVTDGSAGAIITWRDARVGPTDFNIYAQRVNGSGQVQWAADGVPITTTANNQTVPRVLADNAGGAFIAWQDARAGSTSNYDIYAQRVNGNGQSQWTANGVAVSTVLSNKLNLRLARDGSGGVIVAWQDSRNGGTTQYDIYAQRLRSDSTAAWTANGTAISSATGIQQLPHLISDGTGGALCVWYDARSSADNVYGDYISASGQLTGIMQTAVTDSVSNVLGTSATLHGTINAYHDSTSVRFLYGTSPGQYTDSISATPSRVGGMTNIHVTATVSGLISGKTYYYAVAGINSAGYSRGSEKTIHAGITSVEQTGQVPEVFALSQNYPNPFNPSTTLRFTVAARGHTALKIFNLLGQEVATLFDDIAEHSRYYDVTFNAERLPSGYYMARLNSGGKVETRKLMLVK